MCVFGGLKRKYGLLLVSKQRSGLYLSDEALGIVTKLFGESDPQMLGARVVLFSNKVNTTLAGLEPTRNYSNRFLVDRLNHSATVSCLFRTNAKFTYPKYTQQI